MKRVLTSFFCVLSLMLFAQNKTLTLADATLGYWKGLYPEQLRYLHWVNDTDRNIYTYHENNKPVYFDAASGKRIDYTKPASKQRPVLAKDVQNSDYSQEANAFAFTESNNLFLSVKGNSKLAITSHTDKNIVSGQAIARSEYGITKGTFWSPKGNFLAFYEKNEKDVKDYPLVDITTFPATLKPIKYPMAGQGSQIPAVGVYNLKSKKTVYLDIDGSDNHYVTNLAWSPDERYILVAEINRATTKYDLNLYDISTGKKNRTIMSEKNPIWVEPQFAATFLPSSNTDFIWMSQKSGFFNLYIYTVKGKFKKQLTDFKWVVQGILGFDKSGKNVFIKGTGKDARETHVFKVNLRSGKFTKLTKQAGTHRPKLCSDGSFLIDTYSSLKVPGVTQIINTKSGESKTIHTASNPMKDYRIGKQEFVDLKAADGTKLHGIMMKPVDFNPKKKYPVLIYVYGGPHAQMVTNSYLGGASMWLPAFASLNDYIVFTVDNRGSANRGFDFEKGIHRQLGELEMKDQLVGVNYLKSLPFIDSKRIAVNGWSFGGFMTSSLMLRNPGTFNVAVAGGAVIDWKYYEAMYGERYMDTPQENVEGYKRAKVSNYIQNLKGDLLFITGGVDPVVVPQHSLTILKKAVSQNIPVDFFSYPMHEHNVGGKDRVHLIEKMAKYIVKNNK